MSDSITIASAAFFRQLLGAASTTNPDPTTTIIGGWERFYLAGISIDSSGNVTFAGNFILSGGLTVSGTLTFSGAAIFANTGLHIQDTDASDELILKPGSNLTADRTLTLTTGDSDRTLTISGNSTISQDYSTTGTPTFDSVTGTTSVITALLNFASSRGFIRANSNGVIQVSGNSGGDMDRLQFGGTTSSFSAIKSNGIGMTIKLADDSANAPLTASNLTATGTLSVTGHATLEGVTSTGATGTGKFVFDNAPTITGHPTIEGVTPTGATGTGNLVFSASPTLTGTITAASATFSGTTSGAGILRGVYTGRTGAGIGAGVTTFIGISESTTETDQYIIIPTGGTIKNLYVRSDGAAGAGQSFTYTAMKNGSAQATTVTVSGASDISGNDTTNSFSVAAGDTLTVKLVTSAGASTRKHQWGLLLTGG